LWTVVIAYEVKLGNQNDLSQLCFISSTKERFDLLQLREMK